MKTTFSICSLAMVLFLCIGTVSAQSETRKYARLSYMGTVMELDRDFFIGYKAIYEANIGKLDKPKNRSQWDEVNNQIISYLTNPNVVVRYNEAGQISFSPHEFITLDGVSKGRKGKEKKDNQKAAQLYATILPAAIDWYHKQNDEFRNLMRLLQE